MFDPELVSTGPTLPPGVAERSYPPIPASVGVEVQKDSLKPFASKFMADWEYRW